MQAAATAGNADRSRKRANAFQPIPFFQAYAYQYRTGAVAPRGKAVGARSPEEAVRFIGQTMQLMGVGDKRFDSATNKIDTRLSNLWKHWTAEDPPPARVKPVPMMVLLKAQELADASACTARMMWINMFFLCRPGESCATRYGSKFFRLRDVTLINGELVLTWRSSDRELRQASDVHLTFTDQKNKHRNEKVGQKRTSHEKASPTVAVADQVIHLRNNNAPPRHAAMCVHRERTLVCGDVRNAHHSTASGGPRMPWVRAQRVRHLRTVPSRDGRDGHALRGHRPLSNQTTWPMEVGRNADLPPRPSRATVP